MTRIFELNGLNFSGRSKYLVDHMGKDQQCANKLFVGPYVEGGLSGFALNVSDELMLYGVTKTSKSPWYPLFTEKKRQAISTLSGGEQVLLALTCSSALHGATHIGLDCALEQLDASNRQHAYRFLEDSWGEDSEVTLIDNRAINGLLNEAQSLHFVCEKNVFQLAWDSLLDAWQAPKKFPTITLENIKFKYPKGNLVFNDFSRTLKPGHIYRLKGENGAGKSTLLKLICGVLKPSAGSIYLDEIQYWPHACGNRLMSYATQNPDEQWTSFNLIEDVKTRLSALKAWQSTDATKILPIIQNIGAASNEWTPAMHLMDLPRAFRKRLSLVWPVLGIQPWLALDEPTLGQDIEMVQVIARIVKTMAKRGYGVILISHDERLFANLSSTTDIDLSVS